MIVDLTIRACRLSRTFESVGAGVVLLTLHRRIRWRRRNTRAWGCCYQAPTLQERSDLRMSLVKCYGRPCPDTKNVVVGRDWSEVM